MIVSDLVKKLDTLQIKSQFEKSRLVERRNTLREILSSANLEQKESDERIKIIGSSVKEFVLGEEEEDVG